MSARRAYGWLMVVALAGCGGASSTGGSAGSSGEAGDGGSGGSGETGGSGGSGSKNTGGTFQVAAGGSNATGGKGGSSGKGGSGQTFGGSGGQGGSGQGGSVPPATGGSGSGSQGQGGGAPEGCGLKTSNVACDACLDNACCAQETACATNAQCLPLIQCVSQCSSQQCADSCGAMFSNAIEAYNNLFGCLADQCGQPCGASSGQGQGGSDPQGQGGSDPQGQGGSTTAGGSGGGNGDDSQYCVDRINQYRATLGLSPLARWYEAEICSNGEAKSDSQTGQPHGAFGQCGESAQNECPGWPGPPTSMYDGCLQAMWNEGPGADFQKHGHYLNMSSTQFSRVACGIHQTPQGDYWAVQNFQ